MIKKIFTVFILILLVSSCWVTKNNEVKNNKKQEKVQKQFSDLDNFVKVNITDKEKEELLKVMEERKKVQSEIKSMIQNATIENKDKIYEEIIAKRKEIMEEILPYIEKEKQTDFVLFCGKYNKAIKKKLDSIEK